MKTKEFIQLMKRYEALYAKEFKDSIALYEVGSSDPYFILPKDATHISEGSTNLRNIKKTNLSTLLDIGDHIVGYVDTPLEEREEEKSYYLITNAPFVKESQKYYKVDFNGKNAYFGTKRPIGPYQTIFLESEIKTINLNGLEKIEVNKYD